MKSSGVCILGCSLLRGSDRFTATGCVPRVRPSSFSQLGEIGQRNNSPETGCHDSSHGSRSRPHHSHSERTRFRAFRRGSLESFQLASAVVLAPKTSSRFEVFFRMVRSSKSWMGLKKRAVTGIRMGLLSFQKSPFPREEFISFGIVDCPNCESPGVIRTIL